MFSKVGAVILLVSDMTRSINFYKDILGMELKHQSKDWVEFVKQGTVLALHPAKKIKNNKGMLVGFNVSDLESLCNDLMRKNVQFYKELKNETFGKHAIIVDPDGHMISLTEMIPKDEFTQIPYYHGFAPR